MKLNCLRIIVSLAVVIGVCLFPSPVYAGGQNGVWDQLQVAIYSESSGDVGTQIGGDNEIYNIEPGAKIFVVIQANFTTQSTNQDIGISWRPWAGSTWAVASLKGTGSGTAWEFWESIYNTLDSATIHFGSVGAVYIEDSTSDGGDPEGLEEFWFVVEAPTDPGRYELALSEDGIVIDSQGTISQQIDITVLDYTSWGGIFYNKPDDTTEQTEAGTYPDGLYTYLYEDSSNNPLEAGTQYTFYVNVHEWADEAIAAGGTLTITIPKEFTSVALVDKTDFSDAGVSGGGASDWTISGTNDAAISNSVDHLSFSATTPAGYGVNTNWEFDTRFTGTGGQSETVRYIVEAVVLVQAVTWESYNDDAHQNVWGGGGTEYDSTYDMVYMYGDGFELSQLYHVGFYDPSASPNIVATDSPSSTATGNLSAQYLLTTDKGAAPGTWHAVVYKDGVASPPETYIASDPDSVVEDDFEVLASAIPEFPTVMAGIMVAGLCFAIYYWMRKRRLAYVKA